MRTLLAASLLTFAVSALLGCPAQDPCDVAPSCDGKQALNCITSCTSGPCSTGGSSRSCAEAETCEVIPGPSQSLQFTSARAVCAINEAACDPASAPPAQCDGKGNITGCSGYKRNISVSCSQAGAYFVSSACCTTGINADAGTSTDGGRDGGTDGGI
jgi:hypothetical protein